MAFNSTPRRRFGVALGVVLTGVTAGLIGFAGTASAHTNDLVAKCEGEKSTLSVKLWSYNGSKPNTIKVVDGDKEIFAGEFRENFEKKFTVAGDVAHTFTISAKAWDGPDNKKWSFTTERSVEACVTPPEETTTTESTTTTTESTTTTTESTTETTETTETTDSTTTTTESQPVVETTSSTTTTPPVVDEDDLAFTGASIGLPLGIAAVLLAGGVVLLFVVRRRSKA